MVDAGTAAVGGVVTEDIEGTPRPLGSGFDIGCYENDLGTAVPGVPTQSADYRFDGTHIHLSNERSAVLVLFYTADGRSVEQRPLNGLTLIEVPSTGAGVAVFRNAASATVAVVKWSSH